MLTKEQIENNKTKFITLLQSIKLDGIEELIAFLDKSDFFIAPASTKYYCSYEGGLCEHSLYVYNNLISLVKLFASHNEVKQVPYIMPLTGELITMPDGSPMMIEEHKKIMNFSDTTLKIVGLLHDLSKVNFYEPYIQAKKVYSNTGSKYDDMGKFDWVQEKAWKVKEATDRKTAGNKGLNSFLIISHYIPLSEEEIIVLNNQYGEGENLGETAPELLTVLSKYTLTALLHMADTIAMYITKNE